MVGSSGTSRRKFLATAGAGAAAVGVVGAVPSLASTSKADGTVASTPLTREVVVTVADASKGQFNVLIGERAVPVTDLAFASKIAQAIG